MMITFSHRILTAMVGAAIAVGVQALVPGAGPAAAVSSRTDGLTVAQDAGSPGTPDKVTRYWTPDRMAAALQAAAPAAHEQEAPLRRLVHQPAPGQRGKRSPTAGLPPWLTGDTEGSGLRWTHGGSVAGAVGKVFFTLDDEDYVCSGALVGGADPDVVVTAAHCVSGGPQRSGSPEWATNWMFVPGFADGVMPYGEYTANKFFVEPSWTGPSGGSEQYDVAFASVTAASLLGVTGVLPTPAGLPVQFTKSQYAPVPGHAYVFGYPADPPFSGLYANFCAGPVGASDGSTRTACDMTAGDSGGPWLVGFSPRTGSGTVDAVSAYKLSSNMRVLYGAVLGPEARTIYQQALAAGS
jgi:V8-like Glu-specific endopeptidase